ncbi:MAG: hemerythrin family protein [Deltaproteobacteria bacterium]|nr:hemerythrin family protein [Deltaproteobacteria bacterium]
MEAASDKKYITGVPWQDKQHGELFERIKELISAMERGEGEKEVLKFMDFFDEYIVVHFHDEEKAMNACQFPDALSHIKEHTNFIDDFSSLKSELNKGVTPLLVEEVKKRVLLWLKTHTCGSDKKLGAFLVRKAASL